MQYIEPRQISAPKASAVVIRLLLAGCFLLGFSQGLFAQTLGCDTAPCEDDTPCFHCRGTWNDGWGVEWDLTSFYSSVSGTAYTYACSANQEFEVLGTLYSDGYMELTAQSPYPGSSEDCTVTSTINLSGYIQNKGCDMVGPDEAYESDDFTSGYVHVSKYPPEVPTGESQTNVGWSTGTSLTLSQWRQTLTGDGGYPFDGRQVNEARISGSTSDGCWFSGSAYDSYDLSGGWWNVGSDTTTDQWADDYIGFYTYGVDYYRGEGRTPCSVSAGQKMQIAVNGASGSTTTYKTGSVGAEIDVEASGTVTSIRNGVKQTKSY